MRAQSNSAFAPALRTFDYWQTARRSLIRKDKTLANVIRSYGNHKGEQLTGGKYDFETLARSIVGQQISVKAAASIWSKLEKRWGNITPETIVRRRMSSLRACGLSESKATYIKNIATFFVEQNVQKRYWKKISADEARAQLLAIKGVGEWTWQMFAIFYLKQPDILPLGDLGLVNAIHKHYANGKSLRKDQLERVTDVWRPWRTVATWYLWRSIDPETISY